MAESKFKRAEIRKIIGDACTEQMETALVALHLSVLDPLKDDLQRAEDKVKDYDAIKKERDDLKAAAGEDYKKKYEDERKAFSDYKKDQEAKATAAVRDKAGRAYFEGKGITGANLEIAMRAASKEISELQMDGDKIKDTAALDSLVGSTLKGLAVTTGKQGVPQTNPPKNSGDALTRKDIYAKDEKGRYKMSTAERQKALAEHPDLMNNRKE